MVPVPYEIIANEEDVDNGNVHDRPRVATPFRADSYIFVTTKAYQALDAIRSIRDRLFVTCDQPKATNTTTTTTTTTSPVNIVVCCNGALAVVEIIQGYLQNELQSRPTVQPLRIIMVSSLMVPTVTKNCHHEHHRYPHSDQVELMNTMIRYVM